MQRIGRLVLSQASKQIRPHTTRALSQTRYGSSVILHRPRIASASPLKSSRFYYGTVPEEGDAKEVGSIEEPSAAPHEELKPVTEKLETSETVVGEATHLEFQAETRKLLDIVAKSLYTDKEIFIRELISNASDALEKFRHAQVSGRDVADPYIEPEIQITTDPESNTLTIQDFGIGMTKEELIANLGTIARSGTLEYVKSTDNAQNLIGQFGVGFYSAFMVADEVLVFSRSAVDSPHGYQWRSFGAGTYDIAEAKGVSRGTKIVLKLKEDCKEFSDETVVKNILTKHSNFVNFSIKLNGDRVNTIGALWLKPKSEISDEDHESFYKFITHLHERPMLRLHFHTDSPINIKSLLYVPSEHTEKFGLGNMEPGVSLYCRKVLIQPNMKTLLPNYLRFVKGVVDCEDIPLNLSREHLQDSQLVARLGSAIARRLLKFFADEAKRSPEDYEKFWNEFGKFIKEGITTETSDRESLAKLIRAETSKLGEKHLSSLEDYISRMKEEQKEIYYVVARGRSYAEASPYMEHFKKNDLEVLYMYEAIDDWVMNAIGSFKGKSFKAIESAEIAASEDDASVTEEAREQQKDFNNWVRDILADKVSSVKDTKRLTDSPAVIIDHESMAFRRVMMHMDPSRAPKLPKQALEINANHPLMVYLKEVRHSNPKLASEVVEQIYDNALMAAGLLLESGSMTNRINSLLLEVLKKQ